MDDSYILMDSSPCFDNGNPGYEYNDPEDLGKPGTAVVPSRGTVHNYLGAYGGPYRNNLMTMPTPISEQKDNITIAEYYLAQNYPTPFNATALVRYSIPKYNRVTLIVYDLNGCEVVTLVDQQKSQGNYEIIFDGKNISNGVIFL